MAAAGDEARLTRYPEDVPNVVCHHAIISGFLIENSPGFRVGELTPMLTLPHERIYVWTNRKHQASSILSEVDEDVRGLTFWTNAGHVFKLAHAYWTTFEHIVQEYDYHWIYYFRPDQPGEECEFFTADRFRIWEGFVLKASFFQDVAPLIKLLVSDERFFTSMSQFVESMELSYCCLTCEWFARGGYKMHPSHEPSVWEQASVLPGMEAAIVQACRSVEGILGQPGKKREGTKSRWRQVVDLDPDEIFPKTGTSYIDYYYDLFRLRNGAAHSYGKVGFDKTHSQTIVAQVFSMLIISSYLEKHAESMSDAAKALDINEELMKRVGPSMETKITREDAGADAEEAPDA